MSVSNQQMALLQALPQFWLLHLSQEAPKVVRITCVRTEAEPRVEEAQPLKVRHNLYSSAWPHWPSLESRSCWAAEEWATGFLDESLDTPSWSTPINSPFIFLPATTMEPL